jgi:glycosyltransferase involved in cell wall biosynthesis
MRILYVLTQYPKLSETFVLQEIALLREMGHDVWACSFREPRASEADVIGRSGFWIAPRRVAPGWFKLALNAFRHAAIPAADQVDGSRGSRRERLLERLAFRGLAPWVGAVAAEMGAEYIHAHFGGPAATAAWSAARGLGVPFGFTAHAQEIFRKANPWLREKTLAAALPLTISEFHRRFLIERLGPAVGGRFEVVRCGVDLAQFTPRAVAPTHDISSVGRLVEKKGFDLLLRALACLPEPRPSCRIVGDGPLRADLEQQIRRQGLADSVQLLGALPHGRVREVVERSRLFALPCRVATDGDQDGLPVVLMEALALGKAVVSTPVAAVPELVEDQRTGLLAPVDSPHELAVAITRLLGDPALARRLGDAGRKRVVECYDVRKNTAVLADLIRAAVLTQDPPVGVLPAIPEAGQLRRPVA